MAKRKRKPKEETVIEALSPIERLRRDRTQHNRDEFVVYCGFGRGSYYRWITGQTEGKITLRQLKTMCRLLGIEQISDLPDNFGPDSLEETD